MSGPSVTAECRRFPKQCPHCGEYIFYATAYRIHIKSCKGSTNSNQNDSLLVPTVSTQRLQTEKLKQEADNDESSEHSNDFSIPDIDQHLEMEPMGFDMDVFRTNTAAFLLKMKTLHNQCSPNWGFCTTCGAIDL